MVFNPAWLTGIGALLSGASDFFTEQPDPELMSPEQRKYERYRYKAGEQQWKRQLLGQDPKFGYVSTQTPEQQQILSQIMGMGEPAGYAPITLPGAEGRETVLSRLMAVSPEEETAAIRAMSQPAMRQYEEEILPATRAPFHAAGTTWSTMRATEEAKRGVDLAERLAKLGEQYRMERRTQALQATGTSLQEAGLGAQLGMTEAQRAMDYSLGRQGILSGILGMDLQDYYTYGQYEALSPEEMVEFAAKTGSFPPKDWIWKPDGDGDGGWDWWGDGNGGDGGNGGGGGNGGNGGNGEPPQPERYERTLFPIERGYELPTVTGLPGYGEGEPPPREVILPRPTTPKPLTPLESGYVLPLIKKVKGPTLSSLMRGGW